MTAPPPRIWLLLGERRGDNNQLLGLAESIGFAFETRTITYGWWWWVMLTLFPRKRFLLTRKARRTLQPPWPDLVIGIGRRSVAVSRWIKQQSGGRTRAKSKEGRGKLKIPIPGAMISTIRIG